MGLRPIVLSIRPRFAGAIIDGTKTVEVRRRRIRAPSGTRVILYATSPTRSVVAVARLASTVFCEPNEAWEAYSDSAGLLRPEFDSYVGQAKAVCLLLLDEIVPLDRPLTLLELRRQYPFLPPRSHRYLAASDPAELKALVVDELEQERRRTEPSGPVKLALSSSVASGAS